jgi:hypothetical protein
MRHFARFLLLGCLVALPVAAQHGGGMHGGGFRGGRMAGGFRGGSMAGGFRGGGFVGSGFHGGFGFHRGFFPNNRFFFPRHRFFFGAGFGFFPWWGGGFWPAYGYPYYGYPDYGYGYPASSYNSGYSAAPVVIYESQPAPPTVVYDTPAPARPGANDDPRPAPSAQYEEPIYLIAFNNQDNIRAAEAYWVDGGTLNYVTLQHERKEAPLASIDRAFSYRLNRERHIDFRLPPE